MVVTVQTKVGYASAVVDLTQPSSGQTSGSRCPHGKDVSGPDTGSTEEGSSRFPPTDGEVIFTLVFEDVDKMSVR